MNPEAAFFAALLGGACTVTDLRRVQRDHLTDDWKLVHDYVTRFSREHGKLPRPETVEGECRVALPPAQEEIGHYAQQVLDNALRFQLDVSLTQEVAAPLSEARPHDALEGLRKVIGDVRRNFQTEVSGLVMPDVREAVRTRLEAYHIRQRAAQQRIQTGLPTPWPLLTTMTGGLLGIWYILARPNQGKTWLMLLWPIFLWQMGYDVIIVSMETPPEDSLPKSRKHRVVQGWCRHCYQHGVYETQECPAAGIAKQRLSIRIDALAARVSPWRFLNGTLTPLEYQRLVQYYTYMEQGAPAWGRLKVIAAPHINTIDDYETEVRAANVDAAFLDSGYLLMRGVEGRGINDKATELVLCHKAAHSRLGIPGCMSWHFNADVTEEATRAPAAKTIMYTDEINRASDVMLGLFRPPDLQVSGEAIGRTLKVRDGLPLRELKFFFRVKEELNFAEIADSPVTGA